MRGKRGGFDFLLDFDGFFRTLNAICGPTEKPLSPTQKTRLAAQRRELNRALFSVRMAMDSLVEGIMFRDQDGIIRAYNAAAANLLGVPLQERLGKRGLGGVQLVNTDGSDLAEEDLSVYRCLRTGEPILGFIFGVRHENGVRWLETNARPLRPRGLKNALGVISSFWDMTEKKQLLDRLASEATHDFLTDLPNRRAFDSKLERALRMATRTARPLSLCLCDLDHFKAINDHLGHQAGDKVLQKFAELLKTTLRGGDFPARIGGDEFAILFEGMTAAQVVLAIERIRTMFRHRPKGAPSTVTATFGIVDWTPGMTGRQLVQAADEALYAAKSNGRNRIQVGIQDAPA